MPDLPNTLRYQLVRIMKKFFYHKEKIDELLTDKNTIEIQKSQITDFPTNLQPASHTHTKNEITDFPPTMPPSSHSHSISDVSNLQSSLNGKANTSHPHTKSDITDFSHNHTVSEITNFPGNATTNTDGLLSHEDKTKLNAITADSGWVNVPLDSLWVNQQTLQARRIGDMVFVQGTVKPKSGGYVISEYSNLWTIATLPSQFRPRRMTVSAQKATTKRFYQLVIGSDGSMEIGRFSDQGTGEYEMNAQYQLNISATYFV